MNDTEVTVVGNVVDSPRQRRTEKGNVTNFRVASNSRRYDAAAGGFVDGPTLFIDVAAWNVLGGNVVHSISKGDEVIVKGTIATDSWETENGRRSQIRLKAQAVGQNLQRGWTTFHRAQRPAESAGEPPTGPVEERDPAAGYERPPSGGGAGEHPDGNAPDQEYVTDPEMLDLSDRDPEARQPALH